MEQCFYYHLHPTILSKNMFGGVAYINNVDDPLNRDDGNLFPEAYRHLIGKHKKNNTDTINTGPPVDDSNPW